jgi:hypothetical protein
MGRREAPVPQGPLRDFAQGLRDLRAHAPGAPTYRTLAARARYSASALSDAASGRRLPSWEVTAAFVAACGGDTEEWRQRWTRLDAQLRADFPALLTSNDSPQPSGGTGPAGPAQDPAAQGQDPAAQRQAAPSGKDAGAESTQPTRQMPTQDAAPHSLGEAAQSDAPERAVEPLLASDPARVGPFRLLGRLGGGAMGVVYLGVSPAGRPTAVKVLRADLAEDAHFRKRFASEVAAIRRVHGPFTPAVVDADTETERPWLATAYLPGPSLEEAVTAGGPLPPALVLGLAAGIAEALAAIHAAGILHRDLKPGNVLLEADGPKVIDFGVAQAVDASRLTKTGVRVGTVPFMAPEQAAGGPVSGASDIFALGCVLAYAATGVPPFGDASSGEVLYRIAHADPDPAALDCGDERLRELIARCLDKDPDRRPTPQDIIEACGADRPQELAWLPTAAASRLAARREQVDGLLARAATRRTVVRVKLSAVPVVLAAAVAAALILTAPGRPGVNTVTDPPSGTPSASAGIPGGPPTASPSPPTAPTKQPGGSAGPSAAASTLGAVSAAGGSAAPAPSAPATAKPGSAAGPGTTTRVTYSGWSGSQCASSGATRTAFSGNWQTTTGGTYQNGCKAARYVHLSGGTDPTATASWVFSPGTQITGCTFAIHIAAGTWTGNAQYQVADGAQPSTPFTIDQSSYGAGGWYTTARYAVSSGTVEVTLTNAGSGSRYGVVADTVNASCTS